MLSEDEPRDASSWLGPAVIAAALAVFVHAGPLAPTDRTPGATVEEVKGLIRRHYVRDVEERDLEYAALQGMASALDRYSAFYPPEDARSFREDTDAELSGGIGVEITVDEKGFLRVIAPLEGTPAWQAGILPGDRIIEIDGKPAEVKHPDEAARLIKGKPDTTVTLTIVHEGSSRPEELKIVRQKINVPSVKRPRILEGPTPGIGYVHIVQFGPRTSEALAAAIETLRAKGMRALVLDLRSNPGGHLDQAIETADLFIESGVILRTVSREPDQSRVFEARAEGTLPPFPLAVLVNGGSASASEIVSGALKDSGRATIVGTRTYGKGAVQSIYKLRAPEKDQEPLLKLTTARFYTRSGRQIQRELDARETDPWGIEPDVRVDLEARKLQEIFRKREVADARDAGAGTGPVEVPPDPQLDAAVRVLEGKLAGAGAPTGGAPR